MSQHDDLIGEAYVHGMVGARAGNADNPYFEDTQLYIAYASGYRDQMAWTARHGQTH